VEKYNIIAGCRRSGTSMLMYALKKAGVPILGYKFTEKKDPKWQKLSKAGNPNGYWELDKVTFEEGLTAKCGNVGKGGETLKIMFEVFSNSDPNLIGKTILIFREPRSVLSSILKYNRPILKHQMEAFIFNLLFDIIDTLGFLALYKKEFRLVFYEDILKNPEEEMKAVCEFLGQGDYKKAAKTVKQKLNRSKKIMDNYKPLEIMENFYRLAKEGKIGEIIDSEKELKETARRILNDNLDNGK